MSLAYTALGDLAASDAILPAYISRNSDTGAYQIAQMYALRGESDQVFRWLDHAWETQDAGFGGWPQDPLFVRYQGDPRYTGFVRRIGQKQATNLVAPPPGIGVPRPSAQR